jgi:hypothetical protein
MAVRKVKARIDRVSTTGQPMALFLNPDGMEARKTNLPKFFIKTKLGDGLKLIEQRVMGVEVVCGDLHCTFIFLCDDLAYGGQDLMIEIYRLSILYVQKLLKYFWNFDLPKVSCLVRSVLLFAFFNICFLYFFRFFTSSWITAGKIRIGPYSYISGALLFIDCLTLQMFILLILLISPAAFLLKQTSLQKSL